MLTREHAIAVYDGRHVRPDRLTSPRHQHYLSFAQQMLAIYRAGLGRTRADLHRDVRAVFATEEACPSRRIEAFCKLLDDAGTFVGVTSSKAAKLRSQVFRASALLHPLVTDSDGFFENEVTVARERIARELGRTTWGELSQQLFADVIDFHRLSEFPAEFAPSDLLARYNVAQVQAALFDAVSMTVIADQDFKEILRYAKLAGLMHRIEQRGSGYRFELDGPASSLDTTHRYGVSMAKFLPGLLACRGWRMRAYLKPARFRGRVMLELDAQSGLKSQAAEPVEFDSSVEQRLAEKWGDSEREGWRLERETAILHAGQKIFVPDFTFVHTSGRRVHLEIVGFWTPEYIAQKKQTLEHFRDEPCLLAVQESVANSLSEGSSVIASQELLLYKTAIKLEPLLERLRSIIGVD